MRLRAISVCFVYRTMKQKCGYMVGGMVMSRGLLIYHENGVTTMAESNYERVEVFSRGNFKNKATLLTRKHRAICLLLSCVSTSRRNMAYDIKWIIPKLRRPTRLWYFASSITFAAVGLFSKIIIQWLNKTTVFNKHIISKVLDKRPDDVPLITVSNHYSCFDDPGIWATLDLRHVCNRRKMRWSLAAHDICFTNVWHSYFFMLGKCIPIVRGDGVYQDAINFCIEKLGCGDWIHVFPEGKVNMLKKHMRLKWGIGRLILESPVTPIVIPVYHLGMDDVLPNEPPYMLKIGKRVTTCYGNPIDMNEILTQLRESNASEIDARKAITDRIDDELLKLKAVTEKLHVKL